MRVLRREERCAQTEVVVMAVVEVRNANKCGIGVSSLMCKLAEKQKNRGMK